MGEAASLPKQKPQPLEKEKEHLGLVDAVINEAIAAINSESAPAGVNVVWSSSPNDEPHSFGAAMQRLVEEMSKNEMEISELINLLGPKLTCEDDMERRRGTWVLSSLLEHKTPPLTFPEASVDALCSFYCDRMDDEACVPEVLRGLHAILKSQTVPTEKKKGNLMERICEGLCHINVPPLATILRTNAIEILDICWQRYVKPGTKELVPIPLFAKALCNTTASEKDPRITLVLFNIAADVLKVMPPGNEGQEAIRVLWESTSCYFPILFVPRATDPGAVTKQQLVTALRSCFGANQALAKFAIPLLIDKLRSTMSVIRLDTCETLAYCARVYGDNEFRPHLSTLWTAVQTNVLITEDEEEEDAGIELLATVASLYLSRDDTLVLVEPITQFLSRLLATEKSDSSLVRVAKKCFRRLSGVSTVTTRVLLDTGVPTLVALLKEAPEDYRSSILDVLTLLCNACRPYPGLLQTHAASVFIQFLVGMESVHTASLSSSALGLALLVALSDEGHTLIKDEQSTKVAIRLVERIVLKPVDPELFKSLKQSLIIVGAAKPHLIVDKALPLLNEYPEICASIACSHPIVFSAVVEYLIKRLPTHPEETLALLTSAVQETETVSECMVYACYKALPPALNLLCTSSGEMIVRCVPSCAALFRSVSRALTLNTQMALLSSLVNLYCGGTPMLITQVLDKPLPNVFEPGCPADFKPLSRVFSATACCCLRESLDILGPQLQNFFTYALSGSEEATKVFASIINKHNPRSLEEATLHNFLDKLVEECNKKNLAAVNVLGWFVKALCLRKHTLAAPALSTLCKLCMLTDETGQTAATMLSTVVTPSTELLNKDSNAIIEDGHEEMIYEIGFPILTSSNTDNTTKALAYLLSHTPDKLLVSALPVIAQTHLIPTLLTGEDSLIPIGVHLVEALLRNEETRNKLAETDLVAELVPLLLRVGTSNLSCAIRVAVLKCLLQSRSLPNFAILPLQHAVVDGLLISLDDKKRVVREEGRRCRSAWLVF